MIRTTIKGIGDPFILYSGNRYYMYATNAKDGFKYYQSQNLVDWEEKGYCYQGSQWAENDYWAPEVHQYNNRYYLLYSARWKKNHSLRIGLAVSDSPEGPFVDVTPQPFFDFGYAAIDATMLIDDDNRAYMYFAKDCSENVVDGNHISEIYGGELKPDFSGFVHEPIKLLTPDAVWETSVHENWHWNEAPAILKHDGKYHLTYSVNCFDCLNYSVGCAESDAPLGSFVKYDDNPILKYKENEYSGPGHNSFFMDGQGTLYSAFHIHTDYIRRGGDRTACIAKVVFHGGKMKFIL